MARNSDPVVGAWYKNLDTQQLFMVIELDEDSELLEIEHEDGEVEQISLADWQELEIERSAEPDDWDTSIEDESLGDYDVEGDADWEYKDDYEDESAEHWH